MANHPMANSDDELNKFPQLLRGAIRKLHKILGNDPLVKIVKRKNDGFKIRYTTTILEFWKIKECIPSHSGGIVQILKQYPIMPFDKDEAMKSTSFILKFREWSSGSYFEKRLSIQRLLNRLLQEGWVHQLYLQQELIHDLKYLVESADRHQYNKSILLYGRYGSRSKPGGKIITQFTDWSISGDRSISSVWSKPTMLYRAIKSNLRRRRDVTRHSVIYEIYRRNAGKKIGVPFICPNVYRALLNHFGLRNQVVADPNPGFGSKAIACILEDCQYHSPNDFSKLAQFLHCEFSELENIHYDCVFLDNNWVKHDPLPIMEEWEGKADIRLVFVPDEMRKQMPKPDRYVKVRTILGRHDFVYLYA